MAALCFGELRGGGGQSVGDPPVTLRSARLHPGGESLVGISHRGSVVVWAARDGGGQAAEGPPLFTPPPRELWVQLASPGAGASPLRGATLAAWMAAGTDPDGLLLCSGPRLLFSGRIPTREEQGTCEPLFLVAQHAAHITALAVSHAATFAATGAADGTLGLIRLSDGAVSRLTDARHSRLAPITALCFSDGPASTTRLASGASDGSYCIWRVHVGALALLPLKAVVTPAHQPGVTCLHLTRTGALALGDSAGCLRVYASETGHPDGADSSLVWEKGGDGGGAVVASVSQGRPPVPVPAQQPPVQQQHPCTMVCMAHHPGAEASQLGSWVVAAGHSSGAVAIYSVTLTGGGGGGDREHRAASRVLARGPGGGKEGCVLDASLAVGRQGGELYLVAACSDAGVHGMACAVPMPAPGVSAPRVDAQPHRGGEGEARGAVVDPLSVSESPRGELPPMPPPVPSDDEEGDERDERGGPALDEEDAVTAGPVLLATQPQRLQSGANMRAVVAQAAAMQLSRGGAKGASESDDWLLGR